VIGSPTKFDILDGFTQHWVGIFTPPKGKTLDQVAYLWARIFEREGVTIQEWKTEAETFPESDASYWPKPGQALKRIKALRTGTLHDPTTPMGKYWAWEAIKGDGDPCPICAATIGPDPSSDAETPRLNIWHNADAHERAGVPFIGPNA